MIDNFNDLKLALDEFDWRPTTDSFDFKVDALNSAIDQSIQRILGHYKLGSKGPPSVWPGYFSCVHLAFSGGVDSTTLLSKLLRTERPVMAHTIASSMEHPDVVNGEVAIEAMNHRNYSKYGDEYYFRLAWHHYIMEPNETDTKESNLVTGRDSNRPDNYFLLARTLSEYTYSYIAGDCIDELLGGYYAHLGGDPDTFRSLLKQLIPNHLESLDKCTSAFGIRVYLPYGDPEVLRAASAFRFDELVSMGNRHRKLPMVEVAKREGIPEQNIFRRKIGLVQAMSVEQRTSAV